MAVKIKGRFIENESALTRTSTAILARQKMEEDKNQANYERVQSMVLESQQAEHMENVRETMEQKRIRISRIPAALNRIHEEAKDIVFKDLMFECYRGSLLHDEEDIVAVESALKEMVYEHITEKGGYRLLVESIRSNHNINVLNEIASLCEAVAKEAVAKSKKALEDDCVDPNTIKFAMDEDLKQRYDYAKSEIGLDQISELVKNNVLKVVLDEKARQTKQKEMDDALTQELEEAGDKNVQESLRSAHVGGGRKVEEATLFNSLLRSIAVNSIKESAAARVAYDSDDEENEHGDDLLNAITQDYASIETEPSYQSSNDDIEMDLILAESIAQYTMIELMDTLCLENYTRKDLQVLSQDLLK